MSALPHITFVIHDIEGGVASMNHQIIGNADFGKYFNVHIILWATLEETGKRFRDDFKNAGDTTRFYFSRHDNYYLTLKKLNRLVNKYPGIIVTNDGIELDAIRKFGTSSTLFSIVHDFYNLKLAIESLDLADYFICHTDTFTKALSSSPSLKNRVKYLLHGVRLPQKRVAHGDDRERKLSIVSISRLIETKGVLSYRGIEELLIKKGVEVEWKIIGSGELETTIKEQWKGKDNIKFFKPDRQEEVIGIAGACDLFISPSSYEGYGIALLEAMSCGLVPLIYKLPVGVYADLPEDTGFSIESGDWEAFADRIVLLDRNRQLLSAMSDKAYELVAGKYDISKTAPGFLEWFKEHRSPQIDKKLPFRQTLKMGMLDRPYIPGGLARMVKKIAWRSH